MRTASSRGAKLRVVAPIFKFFALPAATVMRLPMRSAAVHAYALIHFVAFFAIPPCMLPTIPESPERIMRKLSNVGGKFQVAHMSQRKSADDQTTIKLGGRRLQWIRPSRAWRRKTV